MDLEHGLGSDDLQRRNRDGEVDDHVMNGERLYVVEVQPGRFLISDRTTQNQLVDTLADRAAEIAAFEGTAGAVRRNADGSWTIGAR